MSGIDHSVQHIREQVKLWCRRIVAGAFVFVLAVAALAQFIAAARLALEASLGPVGSRLFVGVVLCVLLLVVGAVAWTMGPQQSKEDEARQRVSSIVDAITLGYTLAQDLKSALGMGERKAANKSASTAKDEADDATAAAAAAKPKTERAAENPPP